MIINNLDYTMIIIIRGMCMYYNHFENLISMIQAMHGEKPYGYGWLLPQFSYDTHNSGILNFNEVTYLKLDYRNNCFIWLSDIN